MNALSEQELLQRAQQLDPEALVEIYNRYNASIYAYSLRLLGEPGMAEECVSETFSRYLQCVYANRGPQTHLKAYLYRIAHNWITDHFRRKPTIHLDAIENSLPDDELPMHGIVDKSIRQARVRNALKQLPEMQRQVIVLHFLEGWEDDEIAASISKSISATKAILYRAIDNLRKILTPDEAE